MLDQFMQAAINEAMMGIWLGHGGPFGCVITKHDFGSSGPIIVGAGHNRVLVDNDPTSHGEMMAIRAACEKLGTHDLSGCELYTTSEPCTMCLCACLWANIEKIHYGCTIADAAEIGFRDEAFDDVLGDRQQIRPDYMVCEGRNECLDLFKKYSRMNMKRY